MINKKFWIFICGFALCVLHFALISGCAKQEIKNIGSKGKNIVCIGNSLTYGYGADPGGDYPAALSKIVNIPVINVGIDGDTSIGGLKRMDADVLGSEPLLVIIEFGGNDFLRKISLDETLSNIEKMIDKAQNAGAMVAVADIHFSVVMPDYAHALRKLARRKGVIFIPSVLRGILTSPQLKSDFIHPNAKGYALIAERVYRAISYYLEQNRLLRNSSK